MAKPRTSAWVSKYVAAHPNTRKYAAQSTAQQAATAPQAQAQTITPAPPVLKSLSEVQQMTPSEFVNYMGQVWDTPLSAFVQQRQLQTLATASGANDLPDVISDRKQFNLLPGQTQYRTVNAYYNSATDVNMTAVQIISQTMGSDFTAYGTGFTLGDGFYASNSKRGSAVYGHTSGNVDSTAMFEFKLKPNAKVATRSELYSMAIKDGINVSTDEGGTKPNRANANTIDMGAYALYKGYDAVSIGKWTDSKQSSPSNNNYLNVVNRGAMVIFKEFTAI